MIEKTLAKRYAAALLCVSQKENTLDETGGLLRALHDAYEQTPLLRALFQHPKLSKAKRKALIRKPFKSNTKKSFLKFLDLLVEKNRIGILPEISNAYNDLADAAQGVVHVQVHSFLPLSDKEKGQLQEKLKSITGKTVVMEHATDPSLLGGVSLRIGNSVVDGTVANRLKELEEKLNRLQR